MTLAPPVGVGAGPANGFQPNRETLYVRRQSKHSALSWPASSQGPAFTFRLLFVPQDRGSGGAAASLRASSFRLDTRQEIRLAARRRTLPPSRCRRLARQSARAALRACRTAPS